MERPTPDPTGPEPEEEGALPIQGTVEDTVKTVTKATEEIVDEVEKITENPVITAGVDDD